jgi:hypothetical protein
MKKYVVLFPFFLFILAFGEAADPIVVYLTWEKNPESSMTIRWITRVDKNDFEKKGKESAGLEGPEKAIVEFWKESLHSSQKWQQEESLHYFLPQTNDKLVLHSADLISLTPDSSYLFRIGGQGRVFKFRTAPSSLDHPLRFIVGGDIYQDKIKQVDAMNLLAAEYDPLFALFGGDLAYSISNSKQKDQIERWLAWLISWQNTMITSDGRSIPIIPAIGNHEVFGDYNQTPEKAPLFYALFPFPGKQGYNVLDFPSYMALFILDSGHTHPIGGAQTEWLKNALETRENVPNKFALYHVPAYPSVRNYDEQPSPQVRANWVPLFEKYGLSAAFENHEHTYKRSYPIKENRIDPQGVLYLGDGGYAVNKPRKPRTSKEAWYIAVSAASRYFLVVTLDQHQRTYFAVDDRGQRFDQFLQQIPMTAEERTAEQKPAYIEIPLVVP